MSAESEGVQFCPAKATLISTSSCLGHLIPLSWRLGHHNMLKRNESSPLSPKESFEVCLASLRCIICPSSLQYVWCPAALCVFRPQVRWAPVSRPALGLEWSCDTAPRTMYMRQDTRLGAAESFDFGIQSWRPVWFESLVGVLWCLKCWNTLLFVILYIMYIYFFETSNVLKGRHRGNNTKTS